VLCTVQVVPFQRSANGTERPSALLSEPTAMHVAGFEQATADS
jgi:hypothetical protein